MAFRYLHKVGDSSWWLDHRLIPEVRAMFCAMASRAPVGGILARYTQVVEAVAESLWDGPVTNIVGTGRKETCGESWKEAQARTGSVQDVVVRDLRQQAVDEVMGIAEERLCEYPLHPKVQKFFDDFVGRYGHSSIMELTGSPAIYSEGISWLTAWLLFDSPLCAGQEFSTRAVQHKDWPMARECLIWDQTFEEEAEAKQVSRDPAASLQERAEVQYHPGWHMHPDLQALHHDWFEVFEAEVAWWKEHLADESNRKALGIGDKEPFRPALDRARWALPGTIATGCAHTSSLRERSRVLRDGFDLARLSHATAAERAWAEIMDTYRAALPGLAGMGLREAVYSALEAKVPEHLVNLLADAPDGPDAHVEVGYVGGLDGSLSPVDRIRPFKRAKEKSYVDPLADHTFRVGITFRCSLAVARDWHRHRTLYPWSLGLVRSQGSIFGSQIISTGESVTRITPPGNIMIDHHYAPMSDLAKAKVPALLRRSTEVFDALMAEGNIVQAALALPLGTRVRLRGQGGLRAAVYSLELRKYAVGANFEYLDQATQALDMLRAQMRELSLPFGDEDVLASEAFGLDP